LRRTAYYYYWVWVWVSYLYSLAGVGNVVGWWLMVVKGGLLGTSCNTRWRMGCVVAGGVGEGVGGVLGRGAGRRYCICIWFMVQFRIQSDSI
jgi:hypothetical protein